MKAREAADLRELLTARGARILERLAWEHPELASPAPRPNHTDPSAALGGERVTAGEGVASVDLANVPTGVSVVR